jgi:hypothetical protein
VRAEQGLSKTLKNALSFHSIYPFFYSVSIFIIPFLFFFYFTVNLFHTNLFSFEVWLFFWPEAAATQFRRLIP